MFCTIHQKVFQFQGKINEMVAQTKGVDTIGVTSDNIEALKVVIDMVPEAFDIYNETEDENLKKSMKKYLLTIQADLKNELTDFYNGMPLSDLIPNELVEKRKMALFDKCQYFIKNKKELLINYADNEELGLSIVKNKHTPGWWCYENSVDKVYFNPCSSNILLENEFNDAEGVESTIRLFNENKIKEKRSNGSRPIYMTNLDFSPFKDQTDSFYLATYFGKKLIQTHGLFQTHEKTFKEGDIHGLKYNEHMYWNELIDATSALMEHELENVSITKDEEEESIEHVEVDISNKLKFKPTI